MKLRVPCVYGQTVGRFAKARLFSRYRIGATNVDRHPFVASLLGPWSCPHHAGPRGPALSFSHVQREGGPATFGDRRTGEASGCANFQFSGVRPYAAPIKKVPAVESGVGAADQ